MVDSIIAYTVMAFLLSIVIWFNQRDTYKYNKHIGDVGENIVANRLSQLNEEYIVEHNVHIGHSQIDHLVINHGLKICYVIESKYWGGIITGKRNDSFWQQDINGTIKYLPNPIIQNEYHCRDIRKSYSGYHIYSIVVFIKNNKVPCLKCIANENRVLDFIYETSNKLQSSIED